MCVCLGGWVCQISLSCVCRTQLLLYRLFFLWQKNGGVLLKEEDVAVSNVRIDLTRGRHNPLERYLTKYKGNYFIFEHGITFLL